MASKISLAFFLFSFSVSNAFNPIINLNRCLPHKTESFSRRCTFALRMMTASTETQETRGSFLLRKYKSAKGLFLPRLSDEEESLFIRVEEPSATSQPVEKSVDNSEPNVQKVEIPVLNQPVERVRTPRVTDGGWWGKPSPYLGTRDGGPAKFAVSTDELVNPEAEKRIADENIIRDAINIAKSKMSEKIASDEELSKSLIQLGWADCISFNYPGKKTIGAKSGVVFRAWNQRMWPKLFGSNGSIRFPAEKSLPCNAGIQKGLELIEALKLETPLASYADLIQAGFALAVKALGGPEVDILYGRIDVDDEALAAPASAFPSRDALPADPEQELRDLMVDRLGFTEKEMLALCAPGMLDFKFANPAFSGPGRSGPFITLASKPHFAAQITEWIEKPDVFFKDYKVAHRCLSEFGAKFEPTCDGVPPETAKAVNLIAGWGGLGVTYEEETKLLGSVLASNSEAPQEVRHQVELEACVQAIIFKEAGAYYEEERAKPN